MENLHKIYVEFSFCRAGKIWPSQWICVCSEWIAYLRSFMDEFEMRKRAISFSSYKKLRECKVVWMRKDIRETGCQIKTTPQNNNNNNNNLKV